MTVKSRALLTRGLFGRTLRCNIRSLRLVANDQNSGSNRSSAGSLSFTSCCNSISSYVARKAEIWAETNSTTPMTIDTVCIA
jgi:hypothetical protein